MEQHAVSQAHRLRNPEEVLVDALMVGRHETFHYGQLILVKPEMDDTLHIDSIDQVQRVGCNYHPNPVLRALLLN